MKIRQLKEPYRSMALEEQVNQGNKPNENLLLYDDKNELSFNWGESLAGLDFWRAVYYLNFPKITHEIKAKFPKIFPTEEFINHAFPIHKMNWRDINKVGVPLDASKSYLVTDGKEFSTTNIQVRTNNKTGEKTLLKWTGDENTYEDNKCCSGTPMFDLVPTHWLPTDEIPFP